MNFKVFLEKEMMRLLWFSRRLWQSSVKKITFWVPFNFVYITNISLFQVLIHFPFILHKCTLTIKAPTPQSGQTLKQCVGFCRRIVWVCMNHFMWLSLKGLNAMLELTRCEIFLMLDYINPCLVNVLIL